MRSFLLQLNVFLSQIKCRLIVIRREPSSLISLITMPLLILPMFYLINNYGYDPIDSNVQFGSIAENHHQSDSDSDKVIDHTKDTADNPLIVVGITHRLKNYIEKKFQVNFQDQLLAKGNIFSSSAFVIYNMDTFENYAKKEIFSIDYQLVFGKMTFLNSLLRGNNAVLFFVDLDNSTYPKFNYYVRSSWLANEQDKFSANVLMSESFSPNAVATKFHSNLLNKLTGQTIEPSFFQVKVGKSISTDYYLYFVIVLSILTNILFGLGITLVSDRAENILKRYLITPMAKWTYIASHYVCLMIVTFVQLLLFLVPGKFLLNMNINGSVFLVLLVCAIGTIMFSSLTALLASRTTNKGFYSGVSNLVFLAMIGLGSVYSNAGYGDGASAKILSALPFNSMTSALRQVAIDGAGLLDISFELLIMMLYAMLFSIIAHYLFVWYED